MTLDEGEGLSFDGRFRLAMTDEEEIRCAFWGFEAQLSVHTGFAHDDEGYGSTFRLAKAGERAVSSATSQFSTALFRQRRVAQPITRGDETDSCICNFN